MKYFTYTLILIALFSCQNDEPNTSKKQAHNEEITPGTTEDSLAIKELVIHFGKKIVNSSFEAPRPILNESGYYTIDLKKHQEKLREFDIFTDQYIDNEKVKFGECFMSLEDQKFTEETVEEGIDYISVKGCDWFDATYYTANQDPEPFSEIQKLKFEGEKASGQLYYFYYEGKKKIYNTRLYTLMTFVKIDGKWWIDSAERVWKD